MQFLCSTFGSAGDVFPMLGLALALYERGHEILFVTNGHFESLVRGHGLPFEPLGTEADYQASISNPDLWNPRRAFGHVFRSFGPFLKRQYEIHTQHAGKPDVVALTNCLGFGAFVARDKFHIRTLTVHCQPAVVWSDIEPPTLPGIMGPRWLKSLMYTLGEKFVIDGVVCPFLNPWRRELGLPPVKKITRWWNSPDGVLCMFPDWYAPPQRDWPPNLVQTDFPLWNANSNAGLSADVSIFLEQGDPPIVFTPGSANVHGAEFFGAAVEACHALRRRGILLTEFREQIPAALPDTVKHFAYVPLDLLLPRCAAFVHHGGIGSTSQALLAGNPQVLMPLAHDQYDNGTRVERLGVGASIPSPKFNGARLTEALRKLLTSPSVASACRTAAAKLVQRDGLARSAAAIERLCGLRAS
ncbi:MAG: glycosyltransferase [Planctomycetaceae bacterium]